ncbi:gamma-glutamyl hydrolase B-like [Tubulanus polymorphus]|uniref:gamma-glutamyl hydrolase B-like n=1 Tax=Tubulanus polymorphus TaxID=672921 RepID=UPI003DA4C4C7
MRSGREQMNFGETKNYPIYALQWHTEKFNFHWCTKTTSLLHTAETILVAQAAANFFISEARKNNNKFDSLREEQAELIDNYNIVFVGLPTYGLFHYFSREDMTDKAHEARLQRLVDMRKQKLNLKKKLAEEEQSVVLNGIDHQKVII